MQLPKPLPAWAGFLIAAAVFVGEIFDVAQGRMSVTHLILTLAGFAYYLACIFQLHRIVEVGSEGSFRNKPWKVVGLSLIPLFGFFYTLMWPIELASYLEPNGVKMNRIAPGVCLLLAFALTRWDSAFGLAAMFGVVTYLTRCVAAYRFAKELAPDFNAFTANI